MSENIEHRAFWKSLKGRIDEIKAKYNINTDCKDCKKPLIQCECTEKTIEFLINKNPNELSNFHQEK